MKKIISLIAVLFTAIVLTGCSGELDSIEWSQLPKSVYYVREMTDQQFKESVSIKINGGNPLTLAAALSSNPTDLTFTGFDLGSTGSRTITIKYKSVSIYWAYQVIKGDIPSNEVIPSYNWYDDKTSPYTLTSIEDLYGFANIVNGKRSGKDADSFAGKTVKLGANIDLTGKVWEPIGAAPRKLNVPLDYLGELDNAPGEDQYHEIYFLGGKLYYTDPSKATPVQIVASKAALQEKLALERMNKGKYYIGAYVFAEEDGAGKYEYNGKKYKFYFSSDEIVGKFFEGTFDGQGRKITGLSDVGYTPTVTLTYANSSSIVTGYTFGLFGVVNGNVTVKNVTFEEVSVVGAYYDTTGKNPELVLAEIDSVGAAIGFAFGKGNLTLDNVKVLSGSIVGYQAVGGIVGRFYNKGNTLIQNCENYANISLTGEGAKHTGGIAGYGTRSGLNDVEGETPHTVIFKNNANYGNVTGAATMAGAMVRYIGSPTDKIYVQFENCRNFGNITGSSVSSHGLVGQYVNNYTFVDPVNFGTIVN